MDGSGAGANAQLLAAEELAGPGRREGWHLYRPKGDRSVPLALAGGGGRRWRCEEKLLRCYQRPDKVTMLNAVRSGAALRRKGVMQPVVAHHLARIARRRRLDYCRRISTGCGAAR
jgi:hypothetical protein